MADDWALDVKNYAPAADDGVIAAIVRYCGIALRSRDASLISFSDPVETDRVRENFLKKKLALTDSDAVLDGAIAAVGQRMAGDSTRNRVTVYYLLADHFGKLGLFGGSSGEAMMAPVAAPMPLTAAYAAPGETKRGVAATGWGDYVPLVALVLGGGIILSMLGRHDVAVAPAPMVAAATVPAIPDGAGVIAAVVEGEPMVSVYFDTAKSDIDPSFEATTADLRAYAAAHAGDHLQISGYNDPRGDAAMNAKLSKNRAFAVRDALARLGIAVNNMDLVKPVETTDDGGSLANARPVDVTVVSGPMPVAETAPAAAPAAATPETAAPNP